MPRTPGASLAARLILLFLLGSSVIMAGAGYALYHALRMQLEAHDLAEISGKTLVVQHILRDVSDPRSLDANLGRLRDVSIGHPHLALAVRSGGTWVIAPPDALADPAVAAVEAADGAAGPMRVRAGSRTWAIRTIRHRFEAAAGGHVDVLLAVEITGTFQLLRDHALIAALVALLGTIASGILALFVVRRGLSPLSLLASRAEEVTAQRLGARLDLHEAPPEVHGLADSINRMLERLEESFQALEQFSADIAHELRTPLNNLLLQTQVTLSRPRSLEEYQDALHSNLQEIEGLQTMISEMLFLARADRGMLEVARDEIDLAAEARSVVDYFEPVAAERGQAIVVQGEARLQRDRILVRRALTNLVSNAVRYSPDGARITVSIEQRGDETGVRVSNPSDRIEPEEIKRLFTRFARREQSRTRSREGVGLGLAIVESIMKILGGRVEAHWRDGQVSFTLRFAAGPARRAVA